MAAFLQSGMFAYARRSDCVHSSYLRQSLGGIVFRCSVFGYSGILDDGLLASVLNFPILKWYWVYVDKVDLITRFASGKSGAMRLCRNSRQLEPLSYLHVRPGYLNGFVTIFKRRLCRRRMPWLVSSDPWVVKSAVRMKFLGC